MNTGQQVPSAEQLNAWFDVLHRVAQLQFDDPLSKVTEPSPLRKATQDCVDRGWLMAWVGDDTPESGKVGGHQEGRSVPGCGRALSKGSNHG